MIFVANRRASKFLYLIIVCGFMAVIFYFSSRPGESMIFVGKNAVRRITILNLLHIPIYACLTVLWLLLLFRMFRERKRQWIPYVVAAFVCIAYGIFNEWYQLFVPGRSLSTQDIVFNSIGVVLAMATVGTMRMRRAASK